MLPSIAATVCVNSASRLHSATNWRQAARIAGPLSFLKSAMVSKSGARRCVDLRQKARMVGRPARRPGRHALEPQRPQVQFLDEHVDHTNRVLLRHIVVQVFRKRDPLAAILTLNEATHANPEADASGV